MDLQICYWLVFVSLTLLVLFFNSKYGLLRDDSLLIAKKKPYSYARTQLTFWTVIVLSGFVTTILKFNEIPDLSDGVLIILGISTATIITARITDISDKNLINAEDNIQNSEGKNFLIDILSDKNGVSIPRLQAVIFNIAIGYWFIITTISNFDSPVLYMKYISPDISQNNLILMGLSAGTYVAMKTTENKSSSTKNPAENAGKPNENIENENPPLG